MKYDIRTLRGGEGRLYAFGESKYNPIGSFKDNDRGTEYIAAKCPKGIFDIIGLRSEAFNDIGNLLKFIELVDSQKIPNVPFRVEFTHRNLSEDGWREFLSIIFPKRKAIKKNNRRYYLHGKIKGWVKISVGDKTMSISDNKDIEDIPLNIQKSIFELRDKFGYNIQYEIPDADKLI